MPFWLARKGSPKPSDLALCQFSSLRWSGFPCKLVGREPFWSWGSQVCLRGRRNRSYQELRDVVVSEQRVPFLVPSSMVGGRSLLGVLFSQPGL